MMRKLIYKKIQIIVVGLIMMASVTRATEYTWTSGGSDINWTTSANWGWAGYPGLSGDIAKLSQATDVTLNASATLGQIQMNATVARTVTITEAVGSTLKFSGISPPNAGIQVGGAAGNRLVIQPNIVQTARMDMQGDGTLEFQGQITSTASGYGFIQASGLMIFSGSSALSMPVGIVGIGMSSTLTRMVLTNAAVWNVGEIQTGVSKYRIGPVQVFQDADDTSVTATKITLGHVGSGTGYTDYYYLRGGRLSVDSILIGKAVPSVFDMSGGLLSLRGGNITTTAPNGEFRLSGGIMQATNLTQGIYVRCYIPVKVSGAATLDVVSTSSGQLCFSGGVSGSADLTKTGPGPFTVDIGTTNAISGSLTVSNGLFQVHKNTVIDSYDGSTNAWSVKVCNGGKFAVIHDTTIITQPLNLEIMAGGQFNFANLGDGNPNYNIVVARTFVTNGVSLPMGRYRRNQLPGVYDGGGSGAIVVPATWTGAAGDGKWSTGSNWSTGVYPDGENGVADLSLAEGAVTLDTNVRLACLVYNPQGADREVTVTGDSTLDIYPPSSTPQLFVGPGRKLTLDVPVTITAGDDLYNAMIFGGGTVVLQKGCPNKAFNPVFSVYGTLMFTGTSTPARVALGTRGPAHDGTVVFGPGCAMICERILNHPQAFYLNKAYSIGHPVYPVEIIHDGGDVTSGDVWVMRHQAYTSKPFGYFMRSGSLMTTDSQYGITLGGYFSASFTNRCPGGTFEMTGGIVDTYRFSMGFSDNVVSLQKGDVTLGAGGIVFTKDTRGVPTEYLSYLVPGTVNLGGVVLHAKAAWGSALDMALTGTNGDTVVSNATYAISWSGNLAGPGGLVKMGGGTLTLGGTNTFTGPLTVAEGTLMADNGLVNATNLSVTASGAVLTLGSADSFSTNATLTVAAGGVVNLDFSGTATVNELMVNGAAKSPGTYNNGKSYITGAGTLRVLTGPPPQGTVILIY